MHVRQQPNGKWRVIGQDEGRRRSKVAKTEREAKRAGARLMIELGKQPDPSQATVEDLVDLHIEQTELAVTTLEDYRLVVAKMPQWLKDWRVEQTTTMMVDQAYRRLLKEDWTPHRVRRLHEILRPAFNRAVAWGWITANPVLAATQPSKPDTNMTVPAPGDVLRLLAKADEANLAFGCALRMAATTGLRRGELCALQWKDVDLDTGVLIIRRSVSTTTTDPHRVTQGKTGKKGHRVIQLGEATRMALKAHKARQAGFLLERGIGGSEWVFTHDGSRPWRTDYVTLTFGRLRDDLNLPGLHLHLLRHFVATELIASGMDIRTVSGRLGHSRTSTTLDIYSDFMPARDREAADIMESRLGG